MIKPTNTITAHSDDCFTIETLEDRCVKESNAILELTEAGNQRNEVKQIAEFLDSTHASLFFGIFTLLCIEVISENHRKRYGWYFPFAICFTGFLTVLAQVVLPVCLSFVVETNDNSELCTLPGNALGGTNRQRMIMFGVAAWYTAQLILRFLQQYGSSLAKFEKTTKILHCHSRLDFLFNIDCAWQVIYVSSLYLMNLWMIFYVRKENEFDMIFNCVAIEFIIKMDSAFVKNYRAYFHICPHAATKLNETCMRKSFVFLSDIIGKATCFISVVFPIISMTFLFYGPICKPK